MRRSTLLTLAGSLPPQAGTVELFGQPNQRIAHDLVVALDTVKGT